MIKKQEVAKIADLARLHLSEDEASELKSHFQRVIDQFSSLQTVDTTDVEPMLTPHEFSVPLREDLVVETLSVEDVLSNAPDTKDSLFKVPPVV